MVSEIQQPLRLDHISDTTVGRDKVDYKGRQIQQLSLKGGSGEGMLSSSASSICCVILLSLAVSAGVLAMLIIGASALADPAYAAELGISTGGAVAMVVIASLCLCGNFATGTQVGRIKHSVQEALNNRSFSINSSN